MGEDRGDLLEVISSLEGVLEKTEILSARLHEYKYALMRDLLSGRKGISDGPPGSLKEGWRTAALEEVVDARRGITEGPPDDMPGARSVDDGIPVIDGLSVSRLRFDPGRCRMASRESAGDAYGVSGCDIVMALRGQHAGACAIMPLIFDRGILSPGCARITADPSCCDPFFLINSLHRCYHDGSLDALKASPERDGISLAMLGKLPVTLPPLDEQKRISHKLLEVSGKIVDCENIISRLRDLRASLA